MVDIIHRVGIAASADEVYTALTTNDGLSRWWTTDTSGAGDVGSIIKFRFGDGGPDFEVIELQETPWFAGNIQAKCPVHGWAQKSHSI